MFGVWLLLSEKGFIGLVIPLPELKVGGAGPSSSNKLTLLLVLLAVFAVCAVCCTRTVVNGLSSSESSSFDVLLYLESSSLSVSSA